MDFTHLNILAWNIRGAASARGHRKVKDLLRSFSPSLFLLMETHCQFARSEGFWRSQGFEPCGVVEAVGHRGGIWVMARINRDFGVSVIEQEAQALTFNISKGGVCWTCTAIYASPTPSIRASLWSYLQALRSRVPHPWLVLGDFNEVCSPSEVRGGNFCWNRASQFLEMMNSCNLLDLGAMGHRFTWVQKQNGRVTMSKRLDRALGDLPWRQMCPEAFVENLSRTHSDHSPILLRCGGTPLDHTNRPFRFQAAWATHPEFEAVIRNAWGGESRDFSHRLKQVQDKATSFNRDTFGSIYKRKRRVLSRLGGIQRELELRETESLIRLELELQEEYNQILLQEEFLWFQKSRERWVRFGDRNTKFFHAQTIVRRKRNKIHGLYLSDGTWSTDQDQLKIEAQAYFNNIFSRDMQTTRNQIMETMVPHITEEGINTLLAPVTKEEVRRAVMAMHPFKAPGPDGFQNFFYKQYWHVVGDDLHCIVQNAFLEGRGDPALLDTLIVLIPKVDIPVRMKEFRPISLCNVAYKIITKVLVNRLRPFLSDLIGPLQGSFIPGRGTRDNTILAQELLTGLCGYQSGS